MSNINKVAKSIKKSIQSDKGTKPYDTQAEVVRVEGSTAWVQIPGGVDETPVKLTTSAKPGDVVQVRVSGGRAWLTGNETAPPTDDTVAIKADVTATTAKRTADSAVAEAVRAKDAADRAETSATQAQASADQAQASADSALVSATNASEYASRALGNLSTVQSVSETLTWITQHGTMALTSDTQLDPTHVYFIVDANGDYVVGNTHYSIVSEPDVDDISTYYELTIDESLNNYVGTHLALTNEGLWLLPAASGTNKVLIATGAGSTYTTAGTYIIGSSGETLARFAANGLNITTKSGNNIVEIANLGYGSGTGESGTTATAPYYTFGTRASGSVIGNYSVAEGVTATINNVEYPLTASGYASHAEGAGTTASGNGAHAEGYGTTASDLAAHAEGYNTTASENYAHAEGNSTTASQNAAHAEGYSTTASGPNSHTEGYNTTASGISSHAEGWGTTASYEYAHAEGRDTVSKAYASHAGGTGTTAQRKSQTVIGEYNELDTSGSVSSRGKYAFIIGKGTADDARSNALTVAWTGDVDIASGASYKINGTALSASDVGAVPTSDVTTSGENDKIPKIYNSILECPARLDLHNSTLDYDVTIRAVTTGTTGAGTLRVRCGKLQMYNTSVSNYVDSDYIIEQGKNGSWYYRKWYSGMVEATFSGSVTYGTMSASGQLYRSTNNAVAIPSGIFTTTPNRTEITINNASTVVVCATAVASSTTNVNVQVWRSTNSASSIDATIRCTYTP